MKMMQILGEQRLNVNSQTAYGCQSVVAIGDGSVVANANIPMVRCSRTPFVDMYIEGELKVVNGDAVFGSLEIAANVPSESMRTAIPKQNQIACGIVNVAADAQIKGIEI